MLYIAKVLQTLGVHISSVVVEPETVPFFLHQRLCFDLLVGVFSYTPHHAVLGERPTFPTPATDHVGLSAFQTIMLVRPRLALDNVNLTKNKEKKTGCAWTLACYQGHFQNRSYGNICIMGDFFVLLTGCDVILRPCLLWGHQAFNGHSGYHDRTINVALTNRADVVTWEAFPHKTVVWTIWDPEAMSSVCTFPRPSVLVDRALLDPCWR